MKRKLQIELPDGSWLWVDNNSTVNDLVTTGSKRNAMPERTYWCQYSLHRFEKYYPQENFRLAESRDEHE